MMHRLLSTMLIALPFTATYGENNTIEALAQKTYKSFVNACIKQDETSAKKFAELADSQDFDQLRTKLAASFQEKDATKAEQTAGPVINFALTLSEHLENTEAIVKEFTVTDEPLKNNLSFALNNGNIYFECLKSLDLQHVLLHMLNPMAPEQKELYELASNISTVYWQFLTSQGSKADVAARQEGLNNLKGSKLMRTLQTDFKKIKANKSVDALISFENLNFFVQVLELKLTNAPEIIKNFSITKEEEINSVYYLTENVNIEHILKSLGFEL